MTAPSISYLRDKDAVALHHTFVDNVNRMLDAKGWTQTILAKKSGLPLRTLQNTMQLNSQPSMVGAAMIAAALETSVDALMGGTGLYMPEPPTDEAGRPTAQPTIRCVHFSRHLKHEDGTSRGVCSGCLGAWQSSQGAKRAIYEAERQRYLAANPIKSAVTGEDLTPEEGQPKHAPKP